jgi:hypothetical protein
LQSPYRNAIRWGLLLAGIVVAARRAPLILSDYREWHRNLTFDPSLADFWRTSFWINMIGAGFVLAVAIGIFFLLKPGTKK